ncbi:MAG: polysaccharide biosynthesis protein [Actinobacteria bacterium QS_5_72_10]|nr:MAG: polysaccharide biosynthesis protein [Actinobacteria bacterium QS_5_72_10]
MEGQPCGLRQSGRLSRVSAARGRVGTLAGLASFRSRYRCGLLAAADAGAWGLAIVVATVARRDLDLLDVSWASVAWFAVGAAALQALIGVASGLYRGKRRVGSFDEVALLAVNCASVTLVLLFATLTVGSRPLPLGAVLPAGVIALAVMGGARWAWRRWSEAHLRPDPEQAQRLVVLGAGRAADALLGPMLTDPASPYLPVALLDDDPAKANLRIRGVPVRGGCGDLAWVVAVTGADAVLVAIPSADRDLLGHIHQRAQDADVAVLVLPPISQQFDRPLDAGDVRPLDETDLLGRHTVDTDPDQIAGYLAGKRVLITGAGGSIGSELACQVARFGVARLVLADRDESALADVQLSLWGVGGLDSSDVALCDVRDAQRIDEVIAACQPHVVFHAAALKHVPALEAHPHEAVKTNVYGTAHVLDAARRAGVERFVNVSTDKAADPVNVLGYTKRIAERLTAETAAAADGVFLSVRFGNVLGSRGSVLEVFRVQATQGRPLTVTHPEVTRYFMTVGEAVQLVIQAGVLGDDGEVLVLDMGEPVAIAELAGQVAAEHGDGIEITYSGLRTGEKLHEQLLATGETGRTRHHPLVNHVAAPPLPWRQVDAALGENDGHVISALRHLATAGGGQLAPAVDGGQANGTP